MGDGQERKGKMADREGGGRLHMEDKMAVARGTRALEEGTGVSYFIARKLRKRQTESRE